MQLYIFTDQGSPVGRRVQIHVIRKKNSHTHIGHHHAHKENQAGYIILVENRSKSWQERNHEERNHQSLLLVSHLGDSKSDDGKHDSMDDTGEKSSFVNCWGAGNLETYVKVRNQLVLSVVV